MQNYQQYFTPVDIAGRLGTQLDYEVKSVADFSAGEGALLLQALKRWPSADSYAIEIDKHLRNALNDALPRSSIVFGSAYSPETLRRLDLRCGSLDLVVGNPPFARERLSKSLRDLVEPFYGRSLANRKTIEAGFIHLALAYRYLKIGGVASLILPNSFFHGESFLYQRQQVQDNFTILGVESLKRTTFRGTDVATSRITLKKTASRRRKRAKATVINISNTPESCGGDSHRLRDFGPEIKRGRSSSADGRQGRAVHSTHLQSTPRKLDVTGIGEDVSNASKQVFCQPHDILISRVGTRCLGRLALVVAGTAPISDCIFRIRLLHAARIEAEELFTRLALADITAQALQANTGSCAAHITKAQLTNLRL